MSRPRRIAVGLVIVVLGHAPASADDSPLSLADLAAYRTALVEQPARPAVAVGFRELWSHPEAYQGRRVQVQGRVVRRFRQGAFGTFPALIEVWAVSPSGDPFCLVFPESAGVGQAKLGAETSVRFAGTFLKRLRYEGGDGPRLAPLIVGSRPPIAITRPPAPAEVPYMGRSWLDWVVGLAIAAVVALILACQYLRRPVRRLPEAIGPPPAFTQSVESI